MTKTIDLGELKKELMIKIQNCYHHDQPEDSCDCPKLRAELHKVIKEIEDIKWEHLEADVDED